MLSSSISAPPDPKLTPALRRYEDSEVASDFDEEDDDDAEAPRE